MAASPGSSAWAKAAAGHKVAHKTAIVLARLPIPRGEPWHNTEILSRRAYGPEGSEQSGIRHPTALTVTFIDTP